MYHLGIDLGGTKIEGIALDGRRMVAGRRRLPTPESYGQILEAVQDMVRSLAGGADYTLGVGAPGTAGPDGRILGSNLEPIRGMPLKADIERATGAKISLDNDADCFVAAEAVSGAGAPYGTVFGAIMGTGVGGGLWVDGGAVTGRRGMAGEWGHSTLHPGGARCWCGKAGCVEAYIGGPALRRLWEAGGGGRMDIPQIVSMRPPGFESWRDRFVADFALALSNVVQVLDPDAIVLGGGLSNIDFLYSRGVGALRRLVPNRDTPVLRNKLGDASGVIGAALQGAARA